MAERYHGVGVFVFENIRLNVNKMCNGYIFKVGVKNAGNDDWRT